MNDETVHQLCKQAVAQVIADILVIQSLCAFSAHVNSNPHGKRFLIEFLANLENAVEICK